MVAPRVFFRADADARVGHGHVSRLVALADVLSDYERHFWSTDPPPAVEALIASGTNNLVKLPPGKKLTDEVPLLRAAVRPGDILVLDGYQFTSNYQQQLRAWGVKLVCLDDLRETYQYADVVINPAGGITASDYNGEIYTQYCLGPSYALLRAPFRQVAQQRRGPIKEVRTAFVCFGGSDADNLTRKAVQAGLLVATLSRIHVVIGSSYAHYPSLRALEQAYPHRVVVHHNLSAQAMVQVMQQCDLAVASASTIAYELASVGIGLVTGVTADNQRGIARFLSDSGCARSVGDFRPLTTDGLRQRIEGCTADQINQQIEQQHQIFADNTPRLRRLFRRLAAESHLTVRRAHVDDLMTYFRWANEPEARRQAIRTDPIDLATHTRWFERKINHPTDFLYIFEHGRQAIGQVRFEREYDRYLISFSVAAEARGRGLGTQLIKLGLEHLQRSLGRRPRVRAYVRPMNQASRRVFEQNGFAERGVATVGEVAVVLFEK